MGALMRAQGVDFLDPDGAGQQWIAEHWTTEDMDALDAIGPNVFWQWVDRGYAGD